MRILRACLLLAVAACGLLLSASPALAVPKQLAHQGRFADAKGFPLQGSHQLTVTLYDAPTGGAALFSETLAVDLVDGYYTIVIGADGAAPLDDDVLLQHPLFLGVQLDGGQEFTPRAEVSSVPYSRLAGVAASVDGPVTATEIAVGGTVVIDSDGEWIGPTIAGVALADQACAPGDMVIAIDAAGAIQCAAPPDYDGTDFAVSSQACGAGELVAGIDAAGNLVCLPPPAYGGGDFALSNQACAPGAMVTGIDTGGGVQCAPPPSYDGGDFALSGQACSPGDMVVAITSTGGLQCAPPPSYDGGDFALSSQACVAGSMVIAIDASGAVQCAAPPSYDGGDFALSNQGCVAGSMVIAIDATGGVQCAAPPSYDGGDFALSSQACAPGDMVTGISSTGLVQCAAPPSYDGGDFALSNQACVAGSMVIAIDASGGVQCAPPPSYDGGDFALSSQACAPGSMVTGIDATGAVTCAPDQNAGGDITGVTAGAGLTGGGASGDVSLTVAFGGTGVATTASRSDHLHDGRYLFQGVTLACTGSNKVVGIDAATGNLICAADVDTNTTYSAGAGLTLTGTTFAVDFVPAGGEIGVATSAARVDHHHDSRYAIRTGLASGQTIYGGTGAGEHLSLRSTTSATKGHVFLAGDGGNVGVGPGGTPAARLHVAGNTFIDTTGTGAAARNVTIKDQATGQINFGSYPGAWTAALQIQSNDNSRHLWMSPMDAASGAGARVRAAGTGLDVFVGGTTTDAGNQALAITSQGYVRQPNQPFFIAGHSVGAWESCPSGGGWIEAPYNTVGAGNGGGWYSTATGRFTAPVTGLYMFISSHYVYPAVGMPAYVHHQIGVNGSAVSGGGRPNPDYNILGGSGGDGTYNASSNVMRLLFLNAGDYASVFVYCGGNGLYRYGNYSYFAGYLVL